MIWTEDDLRAEDMREQTINHNERARRTKEALMRVPDRSTLGQFQKDCTYNSAVCRYAALDDAGLDAEERSFCDQDAEILRHWPAARGLVDDIHWSALRAVRAFRRSPGLVVGQTSFE